MDKALNARIKRVKRLYGLTAKQWETIFNMQGRKCAVCHSDDPRSIIGWHTDHDHATGQVRGILCHHCNIALGLLDDSTQRAEQLVAYLRRTRAWYARTQTSA